jgi:hypothetical protein
MLSYLKVAVFLPLMEKKSRQEGLMDCTWIIKRTAKTLEKMKIIIK